MEQIVKNLIMRAKKEIKTIEDKTNELIKKAESLKLGFATNEAVKAFTKGASILIRELKKSE